MIKELNKPRLKKKRKRKSHRISNKKKRNLKLFQIINQIMIKLKKINQIPRNKLNPR